MKMNLTTHVYQFEKPHCSHLWKNRPIIALSLIGLLFTLFSFFGGAFAAQVSSTKMAVKTSEQVSAPTDTQPLHPQSNSRGSVNFLIRVDMQGALARQLDSIIFDLNRQIRDKKLHGVDLSRKEEQIFADAKDDKTRDQLQQIILNGNDELLVQQQDKNRQLVVRLKPEAIRTLQSKSIKRNMDILRKRINELGIVGAVIKSKGTDQIIVRLPDTQDIARVRQIIGRTVTLEIRLADNTLDLLERAQEGQVPPSLELYTDSYGQPLLVKKQPVLTGEHIVDAESSFDSYSFKPVVLLEFDSIGTTVFKEVTRENIGKRIVILLLEKGQGKVVTAPIIMAEIANGRVQLSGAMSSSETNDLALLLRAGALAAPMEIIEEKIIEPSSDKNT